MRVFVAILALFTSLTNLGLGFIVWQRNRRNKVNISLAAFALATAIWIFSNFLLRFSTDYILLRLTFSLAALPPIAAIIWLMFFKGKFSRADKIVLFVTVLFGLFFMVTPFLGDLIVVGTLKTTDPLEAFVKGPLFNYYGLYSISAIFVPIAILLTSYKNTSDIKRMQYKFILLGCFLFGIATLLVSVILPLFGYEKFSSFDSFFSLFFVGFASYAIIKYRLMDIRMVVARSVAYAVSFLPQ